MDWLKSIIEYGDLAEPCFIHEVRCRVLETEAFQPVPGWNLSGLLNRATAAKQYKKHGEGCAVHPTKPRLEAIWNTKKKMAHTGEQHNNISVQTNDLSMLGELLAK